MYVRQLVDLARKQNNGKQEGWGSIFRKALEGTAGAKKKKKKKKKDPWAVSLEADMRKAARDNGWVMLYLAPPMSPGYFSSSGLVQVDTAHASAGSAPRPMTGLHLFGERRSSMRGGGSTGTKKKVLKKIPAFLARLYPGSVAGSSAKKPEQTPPGTGGWHPSAPIDLFVSARRLPTARNATTFCAQNL